MTSDAQKLDIQGQAQPKTAPRKNKYDVIVVGAGPAGCITALSFAEKGLSVVLLEKKHYIEAYKPVCTHYIQGCATSVLNRLGLSAELEGAGALRNSVDIWTRFGWIRPWRDVPSPHYGYNVRRQILDPILRKRAANHPQIDLLLGHQPVAFIQQSNVVQGLTVGCNSGEARDIYAPLTVGADGRQSLMARFANAKEEVRINRRNFFVTYYSGLRELADTRSRMWFTGKDVAYAFPCDDGLMLLCLGVHESNMHEFEGTLEQSFHNFFKKLPDAPDMDRGKRVAPITQGKKMHTIRRTHALQGFTMVGDALLSSDPFPGVGIGWAIQAGDWLADFTAQALKQGAPVQTQIRRYERHHVKQLKGHVWLISSYSSGRTWSRFFPPEQLLLAAAVTSQRTAKVIDLYLNRIAGLTSLVMPRVIFDAVLERLRHAVCGSLLFKRKELP